MVLLLPTALSVDTRATRTNKLAVQRDRGLLVILRHARASGN